MSTRLLKCAESGAKGGGVCVLVVTLFCAFLWYFRNYINMDPALTENFRAFILRYLPMALASLLLGFLAGFIIEYLNHKPIGLVIAGVLSSIAGVLFVLSQPGQLTAKVIVGVLAGPTVVFFVTRFVNPTMKETEENPTVE